MVCFVNTYPLDSDLSGGLRYPAFEQPGPELFTTLEDTTLSLSAILCRGLVNYILKLINYSCTDDPIRLLQFGQVHGS